MHHFGRFDERALAANPIFEGHSRGYTTAPLINRASGSVHTGLSIDQLSPGGTVDPHVHAFEEGMYVLAGWTIKSVKFVTRFDAWDPNTRAESTAADVIERDYLAGLTWVIPASRLKLQTAVVRKTWTRDVSAPVTQALTQLQASW